MKDFSFSDLTIIKNMALTKTHKQIAELVECDVADVADVINKTFEGVTGLQTYQEKVDKRNANKVLREPKPAAVKIRAPAKEKPVRPAQDTFLDDRKKERAAIAKQISQENEQRRSKRQAEQQPKHVSKKVDYSKMKLIPINSKTSIYVDPTKDIRQQVEAFKKTPLCKKLSEK